MNPRSSASNKSLSLVTSDARGNTRSPIRRDANRRDRTRLRRMPRSSSAAEESFIEWLLPTSSARSRAIMDHMMHEGALELMEREPPWINPDAIGATQNAPQSSRHPTDSLELTRTSGDVNGQDYMFPTSAIFPPAHQFYESLQREQHFDVTQARARAHTTSPEPVASPDTQHAILQQIENQSDLARFSGLYFDGAERTPTTAPRMRISRSDGLGDRRRSPSNDDDRPSSAEENWNSLMATIPLVDENIPSVSSSFASDSASSILSRGHPRSTLTNTSIGSRSENAEATTFRSLHCPETNDSSQPTSQRAFSNTSSLAPPRMSIIPTPEPQYPRLATEGLADDTYQQSPLNTVPEVTNQGLDGLNLINMLNSGMEVPAEMWAAVGITPHLRDGARRLMRRSERL